MKLIDKIKNSQKSKNVFFLICGFILAGGTIGTYAATVVASSSVSYGNTTVEAAIDDLYNKVPTDKYFFAEHFGGVGETPVEAAKYKYNIKTSQYELQSQSYTGFVSLAAASGKYEYKESTGDSTDSTTNTVTKWILDITDDKFKEASKITITMYNYDGTEASFNASGDSDYYTRLNQSTNINVVPKITINKVKGDVKIRNVTSNCDYSLSQSKIVYDSTNSKLSDQSIDWFSGFAAEFKDGKLEIKYSSDKITYSDNYSGIKSFSATTSSGIASEEKFVDSNDYYNYDYYTENAKGTTHYYMKKATTQTQTYATGTLVLQARYKTWYFSIQYYG